MQRDASNCLCMSVQQCCLSHLYVSNGSSNVCSHCTSACAMTCADAPAAGRTTPDPARQQARELESRSQGRRQRCRKTQTSGCRQARTLFLLQRHLPCSFQQPYKPNTHMQYLGTAANEHARSVTSCAMLTITSIQTKSLQRRHTACSWCHAPVCNPPSSQCTASESTGASLRKRPSVAKPPHTSAEQQMSTALGQGCADASVRQDPCECGKSI